LKPHATPPPNSAKPGRSETIEYEDEHGKWHTELALGTDRPETDVEDSA
jgi:hypothetical protein